MKLTNEDIEEFRRLWKEEFGADIAPEFARHRASQVLELYALMLKTQAKAAREADGRSERKL